MVQEEARVAQEQQAKEIVAEILQVLLFQTILAGAAVHQRMEVQLQHQQAELAVMEYIRAFLDQTQHMLEVAEEERIVVLVEQAEPEAAERVKIKLEVLALRGL